MVDSGQDPIFWDTGFAGNDVLRSRIVSEVRPDDHRFGTGDAVASYHRDVHQHLRLRQTNRNRWLPGRSDVHVHEIYEQTELVKVSSDLSRIYRRGITVPPAASRKVV